MSDDTYLIYSAEHGGQWWGPGGCGYVRRISEAGRYTHADAIAICAKAIPGTSQKIGMLPELPVLLTDVEVMVALYHSAFPGRDPECWE
jgi:hypothetical protein